MMQHKIGNIMYYGIEDNDRMICRVFSRQIHKQEVSVEKVLLDKKKYCDIMQSMKEKHIEKTSVGTELGFC